MQLKSLFGLKNRAHQKQLLLSERQSASIALSLPLSITECERERERLVAKFFYAISCSAHWCSLLLRVLPCALLAMCALRAASFLLLVMTSSSIIALKAYGCETVHVCVRVFVRVLVVYWNESSALLSSCNLAGVNCGPASGRLTTCSWAARAPRVLCKQI